MRSFSRTSAAQYPELIIVDAGEGLELEEDNGHVWDERASSQTAGTEYRGGPGCGGPRIPGAVRENAAAYDEKLALLQQEQEELAPALSGKPVVLFHEAYEYVAHDYGMQVVYVMDLMRSARSAPGKWRKC